MFAFLEHWVQAVVEWEDGMGMVSDHHPCCCEPTIQAGIGGESTVSDRAWWSQGWRPVQELRDPRMLTRKG